MLALEIPPIFRRNQSTTPLFSFPPWFRSLAHVNNHLFELPCMHRSLQFLGTKYTLGRIDVPTLLQASGYEDLRFVEELVLGDWTPEPPQCLRRFAVEISAGVDRAGGGGEGGLSERCVAVIIAARIHVSLSLRSRRMICQVACMRYPGIHRRRLESASGIR